MDFRERGLQICDEVKALKNNKLQVKKLQELIKNDKNEQKVYDLLELNKGLGVPLSTNLDVIMKRVIPESAKVFTSGTSPLLLPVEYEDK